MLATAVCLLQVLLPMPPAPTVAHVRHGGGAAPQAPVDRRSPNSRPDPDSPVVHARRATDRAPKEKPELTPAPAGMVT